METVSAPPTPQLPRHLRGVQLPEGADPEALSQRYGVRRSRVAVALIIALIVVPFLAWVVWAGVQQADRDLRWETVGFSEASESSVTITFRVYLPDQGDVECTVRAMTDTGVEVGRARVPIQRPAQSEGRSTSVVYALPVTERPSSAFVESCVSTNPSQETAE